MATVTQPTKFNHEETQRSVKHPLELLRSYIRSYIILEGLALTLLCASVLFWVGLAFDFGLYKFDFELIDVHGIDWVLSLNELDPSGVASLGCRIIALTVIVIGLLYLGFTRVVWRWIREFNDRALALVLERRFHKELGDRLITAIELADPALAKKYDFSQAMVEKTILEAVDVLKKLPVASVFNWRRLYGLWFLVGLSTVGLVLVNMVLFCVGSIFAQETAMSPYGFAWRFYDVGSIWTERNVLMMNTYWPRRAYLEIGRFQRSKLNESDMRVARDDTRPELQVRAYEWVIADRKAPHGWRALTWKDLSAHKLIEQSMLDRVQIPADFQHWQVDPEELDANLVTALFGDDTKTRTSAEAREHFKLPNVKKKIDERNADNELRVWLDWHEWTVDKLKLQIDDDTKVRVPLRAEQTYDDLVAIYAKLDELAESPSMSRTLRKLDVPARVEVNFRGEESGSNATYPREEGNKYTVSLDPLKDSTRFKFRARGDNYSTPPKTITLVAAPTPASIAIDKQEPAYIYHRLHGPDQMSLRGLKHTSKGIALSTTGDTNSIEVKHGGDLTVHVRTERKLRGDRAVFVKDPPNLAKGFASYRGKPPILNEDLQGFSLSMNDVDRDHEFVVEFFDEDNIRGKRRFRIQSTVDAEPTLGPLNVFGYQPRKPRFKAATVPDKDKEKDKDKDAPRELRDQSELIGAYLITPDARIPLECKVSDNYGLVRVGYHYKYKKVDFELVAHMDNKKRSIVGLEIDQATRRLHAGLAASNFQLWPGNPLTWHAAPNFIAWTASTIQKDILAAQGYREGFVPSPGFDALLETRSREMSHPNALVLSGPRNPRAWEFDFKEDRFFDVGDYLRDMKAVDPEKIGQMHYLLQIGVQATDNNIETGVPYAVEVDALNDAGLKIKKTLHLRGNTAKNSNPYISFLVITENELLSQIALEEEILLEKLEGAKEKVDSCITSLRDQQVKVLGANPDMESVLNRMNLIRTALGTAGNNLRDVQQAYDNILKELKVNRVKSERVKNIEDNIITLIDRIVEQDPQIANSGSLPIAEKAYQDAHQLMEEEFNAKRIVDTIAHRQNMTDAEKQMGKLSYDIQKLLDAMQEGIVESRLIAMIATIEQEQRKQTIILDAMHREIQRKLLEDLLKPEKTPTPVPKEEKKTSQLQSGRQQNAGHAKTQRHEECQPVSLFDYDPVASSPGLNPLPLCVFAPLGELSFVAAMQIDGMRTLTYDCRHSYAKLKEHARI